MVTGSTHSSHCITQPIYATVTKNYYAWVSDCVTETYHLIFKKIPEYISNFPEFSLSFPEFKKSLSFLGFPDFLEL